MNKSTKSTGTTKQGKIVLEYTVEEIAQMVEMFDELNRLRWEKVKRDIQSQYTVMGIHDYDNSAPLKKVD